jgi:probable F420-dependent oxidoreductase
MRSGVTLPWKEITADPQAVKDFAQAAEELGYAHILVAEHILGMDMRSRPDWYANASLDTMFHEPFVLLGYLAAVTTRIGLATSVLALPQRQTALVAKQAAEVDVLSRGRLRLGVGVGWVPDEFQALNADFTTRGRRIEEQITVLRLLFTQESVTFHGRWHTLEAVGINPLPIQRPIPIWLGGDADVTLRRVAAMGDGWLPVMTPDEARPMIERLHNYAREAGRDPAEIGVEAFIFVADASPDEWVGQAQAWQELGADYVTVFLGDAGLVTLGQQIDAIQRFKETLSSAGIGEDV